MKKISIITCCLLIVGIAGSIFTVDSAVDKVNLYIEKKKNELVVKEDVLDTDKAVKLIKLNLFSDNDISQRTILNIKKSNDNRAIVKVNSKVGKEVFTANVDNGVLTLGVDEKNKWLNLNIDSLNDKYREENNDHYFSLIKNTREAKETVKGALGLAASHGAKIKKYWLNIGVDDPYFDDNSGYESDIKNREKYEKVYNVVDVYLPTSVNVDLASINGFNSIGGINIDKDMVKNFSISDNVYIPSIMRKINSESKIDRFEVKNNKAVLNFNYENEYSFDDDADSSQHFDNSLKIKTLVVNTASKSLIELNSKGKKVADEILVNVDEKIKSSDSDIRYDEYEKINREEAILESVKGEISAHLSRLQKLNSESDDESYDDDLDQMEDDLSDIESNKLGNVSFYDNIKAKSGDNQDIKNLIDIFKKDEAHFNLNLKNNNYIGNSTVNSDFDVFIVSGKGVSDTIKINSANYRAKLFVVDGFNPNLKISTTDELDLKYILYKKISNDRILQRINDKKFDGSLRHLIYSDNSKTVENPKIEVDAKSLRIVD